MTEPAAASVAPAPTTTLLEIAGLDAFYGKARVLDDLSFTMERGSLAIVGRNGMGKTTLCNAIMGIAPPHATGSIRFEGKELVGGQSHKIARHGIGYVPQGRRLFPSLTVDEHLRIASRSAAGAQTGEEWTRERVYELFPRLAERKRNGGAQLSGGEQQMLAIARAMMLEPKIILLDEPTEGLMPRMVSQISNIINVLHRENVAILLVEQNVPLTLEASERVYIMEKGVVRHHAAACDLKVNDAVIHQYLGV